MTTHPRPARSTQPSDSLFRLIHFLLGILIGLLLFPHLPGPVEHPIQRPSSPFSIDYLHPQDASSPLFPSTSRFHCRPILVVLSGAVYPVKLEAVDAKAFNHSTQSFEEGKGGEVLVAVAERATEQIILFSLDAVGEGAEKLVNKEIVFRAVDAEARTAYTTAKKVKSLTGHAGGKGNEEEKAACRDTSIAVASTGEYDTTGCDVLLVSSFILIVFLLVLIVLLLVDSNL